MRASSEKKLNILLASAKVRAGGEAVHVYTLARELSLMGHRVYLLTSAEGGGMCAELLRDRIFYAPISDHSPAAQVRCIAAIKKLVKKYRFDVIHCHGRDSVFMSNALVSEFRVYSPATHCLSGQMFSTACWRAEPQ